MATSATVLRIAPSLSDDTRIDDTIAVVVGQLSFEAFGAHWAEAVAALVAHRLLSSPEDGDGLIRGPITAEKTGNLSRSYANASVPVASSADADLSTTAAGRYYLSLRDASANIGGPMVLL